MPAGPDIDAAAPLRAETPPGSGGSDWTKKEVGLAIRNAVKLGSSLIVTWGIALAVRLYVPRHLGPDLFGILNFADAFTATAFVALGLGVETYVRKEISVRPAHASEFIGGVVALRIVIAVLIFFGMDVVLLATHRTEEVRHLVYLYGVAQFFVIGSATSAGLLHAKGNVNEMSVLSVITKVIWAIGILFAIVLKLGLWAYAVAFLTSEGIKSAVLFALARKHLAMKIRIDLRATGAMILASLPFYIAAISTTVYNRLDVSILAVQSTDREVGWYGAASGLANLTLLLSPLIGWVLMPLFARAAAVSEDELCQMARRSLELILAVAFPAALMMAIGAEVWISIVFGEAFAPAVMALRILAAVFLVMYVSIVCSSALTMMNRAWTLTRIFALGLVVNPTLNLALIHPGLAALGHGGGGAACATATLLTEIAIVTPMLLVMGPRAVDARLLRMIGKTLVSTALVVALDVVLRRSLGPVRLVVDGLAYVVLVLGSGALNVGEMTAFARTALAQRKAS